MRRRTWGNKMKKVRTRLGSSAYHMRRWLRLLWRSWSLSSYPWPKSMLHPGGIDRNTYLLLSSFFEDRFEWMFLFSSHMLSPTFNPWGFLLLLSNCLFIVFCVFSMALVACSQLLCNLIRNFSTHRISIWTIRSPFQGCLPKFNSNGVFSIAACFLSLYWNSAAASQSV